MHNNQEHDQPIVQKVSTRSDPAEAGISLQPVHKREVVRVGENSCFILQSIIHPVPTTMSANLNGSPLTTKATIS